MLRKCQVIYLTCNITINLIEILLMYINTLNTRTIKFKILMKYKKSLVTPLSWSGRAGILYK